MGLGWDLKGRRCAVNKILKIWCLVLVLVIMSGVVVIVSVATSDLSDCVYGSPKETTVGKNIKLQFGVALTKEPCRSRVTLHNVTGAPYVRLLRGHRYNYTIVTGSYPQIIHEPSKEVTGGNITCSSFVDANGKVYYDWIPAIKLE